MSTIRLISEREACAALGISRGTLFGLRRAGLPYVKIGRAVRYRPADLEQFVAQSIHNAGRNGGDKGKSVASEEGQCE